MKNYKNKLYVCAFFTLFFGCAKEKASLVNQSAIYTSYRLTYDEEMLTLSADANFNFGGSNGTYLTLDNGSYVKFDENEMKERANVINQVYYEWTDASVSDIDIFKEHFFEYKDTDGKIYGNKVVLPSFPKITIPATSIDLNSSFTIYWETTDVISNSYVEVTIRNDESSQKNSTNQKSALSGSVLFTAEQTKKLSKGNHEVRVCRVKTGQTTESTPEGSYLYLSVCLKPVFVNVK